MNCSALPTNCLRKREHNEEPDICKADRTDNLQMIRRMKEGHTEWLAVCRELKSQQNRET